MTHFDTGYRFTLKTAGLDADREKTRASIASTYAPPTPAPLWATRPWDFIAQLLRARSEQPREAE